MPNVQQIIWKDFNAGDSHSCFDALRWYFPCVQLEFSLLREAEPFLPFNFLSNFDCFASIQSSAANPSHFRSLPHHSTQLSSWRHPVRVRVTAALLTRASILGSVETVPASICTVALLPQVAARTNDTYTHPMSETCNLSIGPLPRWWAWCVKVTCESNENHVHLLTDEPKSTWNGRVEPYTSKGGTMATSGTVVRRARVPAHERESLRSERESLAPFEMHFLPYFRLFYILYSGSFDNNNTPWPPKQVWHRQKHAFHKGNILLPAHNVNEQLLLPCIAWLRWKTMKYVIFCSFDPVRRPTGLIQFAAWWR